MENFPDFSFKNKIKIFFNFVNRFSQFYNYRIKPYITKKVTQHTTRSIRLNAMQPASQLNLTRVQGFAQEEKRNYLLISFSLLLLFVCTEAVTSSCMIFVWKCLAPVLWVLINVYDSIGVVGFSFWNIS